MLWQRTGPLERASLLSHLHGFEVHPPDRMRSCVLWQRLWQQGVMIWYRNRLCAQSGSDSGEHGRLAERMKERKRQPTKCCLLSKSQQPIYRYKWKYLDAIAPPVPPRVRYFSQNPWHHVFRTLEEDEEESEGFDLCLNLIS